MRLMNFQKSQDLLFKYNIPFCDTKLAKSKEDAFLLAEEIGYPVVLKVFSEEFSHKSDVGLVKANIQNRENLGKVWQEIEENLGGIKPEGFFIQKMILGEEIVLGMKRDKVFGPVIMFGLGGIFTEILKDVVFRAAPLNEEEAEEMMREIKGYGLLRGYRGKEGVNIKKIAEIIVSLSKLSLNEKVEEIDLNPLIANSKKVLAVDVRILI